jgi:hypothetical protein
MIFDAMFQEDSREEGPYILVRDYGLKMGDVKYECTYHGYQEDYEGSHLIQTCLIVFTLREVPKKMVRSCKYCERRRINVDQPSLFNCNIYRPRPETCFHARDVYKQFIVTHKQTDFGNVFARLHLIKHLRRYIEKKRSFKRMCLGIMLANKVKN